MNEKLLDILLSYVQKTNPKMTREKLIEELRKSEKYTICTIMVISEQ